MARRPGSGRKGATALIFTEFAAVGFLLYFVLHTQWYNALLALSVGVAVPCWVVVVEAPTRCGVTTLKGHPCPNGTTGLVLGCNNAPGHAWAKLFARFGWHRVSFTTQAAKPSPTPKPAATIEAAAFASEPVVVKIAEDMKSTVTFWMAMISTASSVLSAAGLFVKFT